MNSLNWPISMNSRRMSLTVAATLILLFLTKPGVAATITNADIVNAVSLA